MKAIAMRTQEGNQLAERIVDAAVTMRTELEATAEQCEQFIVRELDKLSTNEKFTEAAELFAKLDCFNMFRIAVLRTEYRI